MSRVTEHFGCGGPYAEAPHFLASLECELENIRHPKNFALFSCKKDNSLRNNGYEFVSTVALPRDALVNGFTQLHKELTFYEKGDPFSSRTSTHVHVNVSSLKLDDVKRMLLLYALFEEFFFIMVKPERRDNIHCVPLNETCLADHYKKGLVHIFSAWHKYTAFNLKRLNDLGTVEFRHMHGTGDAKEIDVWLHVLENLWKLSQRIDINEKTLSDKVEITSWFELLFFPSEAVMALKPTLFNVIRNSLIDVKMSTIA